MVQIFNSFQTIDWGGGKSTELFIFPVDSEYKSRDFLFRLSTATVEIEESTFTPLEGVLRKLMVLDGAMNLFHEGHHESQLGKFDVDDFDGGWNTKSKGSCVDFNLMLREGSKGSLRGIGMETNEELEGEFFGNHFFIWAYKGGLNIQFENESYHLKENELFYVSDAMSGRLSVQANTSSELVLLDIL